MRGTDGANTTTPPTAAAIRAEIDSNSTKLDVAVSTRNAVAPDNAGIADIQSRIPAALVGGKMDSSLGSIDGSTVILNKFKDVISALNLESDTAQGGTSTSITLNAGSSREDNHWRDHAIYLNGGTGEGQFARIEAYDGTTKVATIVTATNGWQVTPDGTTTYVILPIGAITHVSSNHTEALAEITNHIDANSTQLSAILTKLPFKPTKGAAFNNFKVFMVLASDSKTGATGLTVSGVIQQGTGAYSALTNPVVEIGNGMYRVDLTAAEMNADSISLIFTAATADARVITMYTQAA
jgi:hypothetical protein